MKKQTCAALLLAVIMFMLSGCSLWALEAQLDTLEEAVDNRIDAAEAAAAQAFLPEATVPAPTTAAPVPPVTPAAALTKEDAEAIALKYAGFTKDQVSYLRTEYEIDDRILQYDVQFHEGRWEYEFEIHAETGQILSFDKDN